MVMVLQSEENCFLYLLRMELFSSSEKKTPSLGDNINKGNTFVHLTDLLLQSNSVNNDWPTDWVTSGKVEIWYAD